MIEIVFLLAEGSSPYDYHENTHGQVFGMKSSRKSHLPRTISRKTFIIMPLIVLILMLIKNKNFEK